MKANMMYYHIYLYHGSKYNYYCVITQTLQNGQTLGQFFELLYSPLDNSSLWSIKSHLLAFNQTMGCHTGQVVGQELVDSIKRFGFEDRVRGILHPMLVIV